jgi:uncharacterized protein involved in cysteine biosynthesis
MRSRPQPGAEPLKYRAVLRRRVNRFTLAMIFCVYGLARSDPSSLPLNVRVFGINLVLFPTLKGYVRRWGYFEVVALRRLDAAAARAMRNRFVGRITLGGAVIAGLFALPRVNLVAPVVATARMVDVFEILPGAPPQPAASSTA